MTNELRTVYEKACEDLASLQNHLCHLEECGIAQPWPSALHADVGRFARALRAAVEDAERRSEGSEQEDDQSCSPTESIA
jgi:hypothetical protein